MLMLMMMMMMMMMMLYFSGDGDGVDSDENDYCNYDLPAAVVMHDDVYGRLVDFKSPHTSPRVPKLVAYT